MRELIVAEFITLDGVIQAPGGAVEAVRQLKQEPGKNILVDGSSVLTKVLAQTDLMMSTACTSIPSCWVVASDCIRKESAST